MYIENMIAIGCILLFCQVTPAVTDCLAAKFKTLTDHTACLEASKSATSPQGVSQAEADQILLQHNKLRASITDARNMEKLVWDDEIAGIAQKWADNCINEHENPPSRRTIPGRFSVGQNLATGYGNWSDAVRAWFNEQNDFTYGDKSKNDFGKVGHYTQMVWHTTTKLGCGYSTCSNLKNRRFYVCNYGPGGNVGQDWHRPYARKNNSQCDSCPKSCIDNGDLKGLCDCEGRSCYNGGTLDLNTCTCKCLEPEPLHLPAHDCAVNCTGTVDNQNCGKHINGCKGRALDLCPHMCDICPYGGFGYKEVNNQISKAQANETDTENKAQENKTDPENKASDEQHNVFVLMVIGVIFTLFLS